MRKIILGITIILFCFLSFSFADEADRQISKYTTAGTLQIKTSAGEVFGLTIIATAANGWIALYDASSNSNITSSTEPKIEIQTATQYNSAIKDFPEGFNFYNGIYMEGTNVKAVIYYR
jgi:hypothetical protein